MTVSNLSHPKPTAQVEPYFEVLGLDDTLRFIEAFGGTEIYIAGTPQTRSSIVAHKETARGQRGELLIRNF